MENNVRWDRNHKANYDFRTLDQPIKNCHNCKHGVNHTQVDIDSRSYHEIVLCPKQPDIAIICGYSVCDKHEQKPAK